MQRCASALRCASDLAPSSCLPERSWSLRSLALLNHSPVHCFRMCNVLSETNPHVVLTTPLRGPGRLHLRRTAIHRVPTTSRIRIPSLPFSVYRPAYKFPRNVSAVAEGDLLPKESDKSPGFSLTVDAAIYTRVILPPMLQELSPGSSAGVAVWAPSSSGTPRSRSNHSRLHFCRLKSEEQSSWC
jgi:hypothetical protein